MDDVSTPPSSDDEESAQFSLQNKLKLLEKAREVKRQKRGEASVSIEINGSSAIYCNVL